MDCTAQYLLDNIGKEQGNYDWCGDYSFLVFLIGLWASSRKSAFMISARLKIFLLVSCADRTDLL